MSQVFKRFIVIYLKGLAMGAADVVPGVSGGTIALITHIYERLIRAIDLISLSLVLQLFSHKRKEAWRTIDGSFLLSLMLGIFTSILLLTSGISWVLTNHPIPLWAFFFGLILGSAFLLKKNITNWNVITFLALFIGAFIAFGIGLFSPSSGSENLFYLFICGMLVVVAMILPGISGAFILILLGAYDTALKTVDQLKGFESEGFIVFLVMASGGIVGLKAFSKLLRWLFAKHKEVVLAAMTGFLFGSLFKVWPWKTVTEFYVNGHGEKVPLSTVAVLPDIFNPSANFVSAIIAFMVGILLLFLLERISKIKHV